MDEPCPVSIGHSLDWRGRVNHSPQHVAQSLGIIDSRRRHADQRHARGSKGSFKKLIPLLPAGLTMGFVIQLNRNTDRGCRSIRDDKIKMLLGNAPAEAFLPGFARAMNDIGQANLRANHQMMRHRATKRLVKNQLAFGEKKFPRKIGQRLRPPEQNLEQPDEQDQAGDPNNQR